MRIYLDNCCFNRPFDDQSQIRIRLESEAKLKIQDDIIEGSINFVWSYILEAENTANPFEERERAIREWRQHAIMNIKENSAILEKAKDRKTLIKRVSVARMPCISLVLYQPGVNTF